jgi:hypothetical protein
MANPETSSVKDELSFASSKQTNNSDSYLTLLLKKVFYKQVPTHLHWRGTGLRPILNK